MINEIGIYDSDGNLQSVEELGAKGINVSINVDGLQSDNANAAIGEINGKIGEMQENTNNAIDGIKQDLETYSSGINPLQVGDLEELYVGELVQGGANDNGTVDSSDNTSLVSRSKMMLPKGGLTLTVHITSGYKAELVYGVGSVTHSGFVEDGETITTPSNNSYYRVVVKKANDGIISDADKANLDLFMTYQVAQTMWPIGAYASSQIALVKKASNNGKLPIISHISDVHSDSVRTKRMLDFSTYIGVVCACNTGDNANSSPGNSPAYWMGGFNSQSKCNVLVCRGNHDSDDSQYNEVVNLMANKIGKRSSGELNMYMDFPLAKLRILCVNQNRGTGYTQSDEDYICNAVLGTPAGFGLIIMYHIPETRLYGTLPQGEDITFWDGNGATQSFWYNQWGQMIQNIVDAFIGGTTYNKVKSTGTVNFAYKNFGAKFVAHMTGHEHSDQICNLQVVPWNNDETSQNRPAHRQIMLNVTSGNIGMGASKSATNYTQDAFNVYAIDLDNEVIKVVRIGWDKGGTRQSMTISFSQDD